MPTIPGEESKPEQIAGSRIQTSPTDEKVPERRIIVLRRVIVENGPIEGLLAADSCITSLRAFPLQLLRFW